jgi:DNA processing protein
VITPGDDQYPPGLREIQAPPPILFVRGRALGELGPGVSIVGSRVCTGGAARFASELAESIARAGFTVVSGLARGIDGAAHRGALRAGDTIAVLGAGIDIVYPAEHRELAKGCERSGAIVSEFPPGVRPKAWHFPARNRIISGWSLATIVVEGGERSGSLITASFALDQGRDVFACTTAPRNPAGAGVRALLREGARLIVDVDDAVRDLRDLAQESGLLMEATASGSSTTATEPLLRSPRDHELSADAALVLPAVLELTTVDHLVAETGLVSGRVSAGLLELELLGLVADDGGGRWRRM